MSSIIEFSTNLLPIIGVVVGAAIPLIKDWISGRRAEKLERIKLHDVQKISAYQKAYKFSSSLRMSLIDRTQSKDLAFLNACAEELFLVIENLPYYSPTIRNSLIELEGIIEFIMNNITEEDKNSNMVNEKVSLISEKLKREIINDFKIWK